MFFVKHDLQKTNIGYTLVCKTLWKFCRSKIQPGTNTGPSNSNRKETEVFRTLLLVSLVFILCWAPIQTFLFLAFLGYKLDFKGLIAYFFFLSPISILFWIQSCTPTSIVQFVSRSSTFWRIPKMSTLLTARDQALVAITSL